MTKRKLDYFATGTFNNLVAGFWQFPDEIIRFAINDVVDDVNAGAAHGASKRIASGGCPIDCLGLLSATAIGLKDARSYLLGRNL